MTEVCEVWSTGQLAALVIGTTALASAAVLAVILGCVWLAHSWPAPLVLDAGPGDVVEDGEQFR